MSITPLFDERAPLDRDRLAGTLQRLAAERIWIGTSSWKYEGWLGRFTRRQRYLSRGKFARKQFEAECLAEYARTVPRGLRRLLLLPVPPGGVLAPALRLRAGGAPFGFKVPEMITVKMCPSHPRYGARAGTDNKSFLDAALFQALCPAPRAAYGRRVARDDIRVRNIARAAIRCPASSFATSTGSSASCRGSTATRSRFETRSASDRSTSTCRAPRCRARVQRLDPHARTRRAVAAARSLHRRLHRLPCPSAARAPL